MKNKIKSILTILFVSSMILCICGFNALAAGYTTHTSYVEEHTDWIQNDNSAESQYPENVVGSCPYVAISLLLSFYDAYWRDEFVPSEYEINGRIDYFTADIFHDVRFGLENEAWNNYVNTNNVDLSSPESQMSDYIQFVETRGDEFFHTYLISLGITQGYHLDGKSLGLYDFETVLFLYYYLSNICGFTSDQVVVHLACEGSFYSKQDLFEIAKEQIENGFPVLYTAYTENASDTILNSSQSEEEKSGHVLFAYKLTDDKNDIVLTPCWNGAQTQTFYTTEYACCPSIIWLEIKEGFDHVCSGSYIENQNQENLCVCQIYSEHPNHVHSYNAMAYSTSQHWKRCLCGDGTQYENHTIEYQYTSNDMHNYVCTTPGCNYEYKVEHQRVFSPISSSQHSATCDTCGHFELEAHVFRPSENPRYYRCYKCGYTRDEWGSGGGNVIMGTKKEDEIE